MDVIGIFFLLGSFALICVHYFYELRASFDPTKNVTMLLALLCWIFASFQTLNNYKKKQLRKTEEGLYWVHFIARVV